MEEHKQLTFLSNEDFLEKHLRKMGVDPEEYIDPHDIRRGRPAQGERSTLSFFPKLGLGEDQPYPINNKWCWIERGNREDKYQLDHRIVTSNGKVISRSDTETRTEDGGDFPFKEEGKKAHYNVPIKTHDSNWQNWPEEKKPLSGKIKYYLRCPFTGFFISLRYTRNEGVCIWVWDLLLSRIEFQSMREVGLKPFMVFQVPREKTCYGRINEESIENFVIRKLSIPEKTLAELWKKHKEEIKAVRKKLWTMNRVARELRNAEIKEFSKG